MCALAVLVQLFGIGFAAFGDTGAQSGLGPHVERQGTSDHYTHDEANCPSCAVRHLVGTVVASARATPVSPVRTAAASPQATLPAAVRHRTPAVPRAPPLPG